MEGSATAGPLAGARAHRSAPPSSGSGGGALAVRDLTPTKTGGGRRRFLLHRASASRRRPMFACAHTCTPASRRRTTSLIWPARRAATHPRYSHTQERAREMGSLMAGWDSPVLADDDRKVHARRNRSLTKEEVEAFWKQQRRSRRSEHGGDLASPPATATGQESAFGSSEKPAAVRVDGVPTAGGSGDDDAADSPSMSRDWWTRSSWAFLNEPPQEEPSARAQQRYTPQFHVARIATTGNA